MDIQKAVLYLMDGLISIVSILLMCTIRNADQIFKIKEG